jgi:hypothetical protein
VVWCLVGSLPGVSAAEVELEDCLLDVAGPGAGPGGGRWRSVAIEGNEVQVSYMRGPRGRPKRRWLGLAWLPC